MGKTLVEMKESARAVIWRCFVNKVFKRKIHRKISVPESFFNEVSGFESCNIVKK